MPIQESDKKVFSLLEVTGSIQRTLSERYSKVFWVKAEMNKLNLHNQSGHCYPELVEKRDGKVIAQMKSILWGDTYLKCNRKFQKVLNEPLRDGIKILFLGKITFHAVHGLSLEITDIDPSYTLGDLEKEKQETIQQLITDGIVNNNKLLPFPLLPQRLAIISVETSKGYADFDKVISTNDFGYRFFTMLFPAILQGDRSIDSIIYQMNRVRKVLHHFDVVAIIRGGGGDVGLSSYNNYRLAREIATFPIPVITGIGHATNETVAEMVSHYNAITPTKLAEHLIQYFHNFAVPVREAENKIYERGLNMIAREKERFASEIKLFRSVTENMLLTNKHNLQQETSALSQYATSIFGRQTQALQFLKQTLTKASRERLKQNTTALLDATAEIKTGVRTSIARHSREVHNLKSNLISDVRQTLKTQSLHLSHMSKNIDNMSPKNVLKRGYSITMLNGHAVKSATEAKPGDVIITEVFDGTIQSTITKTELPTNE